MKKQIINSTAVQMNFKSVKSYCVAPLYDMFTKQEWNCSCWELGVEGVGKQALGKME